MVSTAYDVSLEHKQRYHIRIGVQGGIISKSINFSKLIFNSQLNNGTFDPNVPSGEKFTDNTLTLFDINGGFLWYYDRGGVISSLPFLGVAVHHLTQPNESFLGGSSLLFRRFIFYGGIKYHEIINFTGVLNNTQLSYYEKYLFEKYSNKGGLYFAKSNVDPAGWLSCDGAAIPTGAGYSIYSSLRAFLVNGGYAYGRGVNPDDPRDRKSTRLNSSHVSESRMPSSA